MRKISIPPEFFFGYLHAFTQVPCVHSSTHVTATVSIVPAVRMSVGQGTLSPLCLSAQHSLVHYTPATGIHSLPPHSTLQKSTRSAHFAAHVQQSHIRSTTLWARHRSCSYPSMRLCFTRHTRTGRFPFHSYRCQNTETSVTPTLPLHCVSFLWPRVLRISR